MTPAVITHIIIFVFSYVSSMLYDLYFTKRTRFGKYGFLFRLMAFITCYALLLLLLKTNNLYVASNNFGVVLAFSLVVSVIYTAIAISFTAEIFRIKNHDFKMKYLIYIKQLKLFPTVSIVYLITGLIVINLSLFFANNIITDYQASEIEQRKLFVNSVKKMTLTGYFMDEDEDEEIESTQESDYVEDPIEVILKATYDIESIVIDDDLIDFDYPLIKMVGSEALKKVSDTTIVVIGDSFVWGQFLTNMNNVYWNQLSYELTERGYNCTVYGVGIGGATTYDEFKWLTDSSIIQDLDPDIVIIGYVPNDADMTDLGGTVNEKDYSQRSIMYGDRKNNYFLGYLENTYGNVFYAYNNFVTDKTTKNGVYTSGQTYAAWEYELVQKENLKKYEEYVVKPLAKFVESSDIPIVMMTTPSTPNRDFYADLYKPVVSLFEKYNIETYDFLDPFCNIYASKKHANNYTVLPTDDHPGTATSYFYAQYIADWIQSDYSEILGKKDLTKSEDSNLRINDWTPYELDLQSITSSATEAEYTLIYPNDDSNSFLNLPIYEDYVMVSFEQPVNINSITLSGDNLASATLYYNSTNPDLGYDDLAMHKLGKVKGSFCNWTKDKNAMVTSLCIHADTSSDTSETLTLTVKSN